MLIYVVRKVHVGKGFLEGGPLKKTHKYKTFHAHNLFYLIGNMGIDFGKLSIHIWIKVNDH